ncbi:autotransporter outer membrane beta-barrel domain-containing protein [Hyphomicrobium sp. D-2]|uniref:autotransporter outer membrane beta-barrel domain-containing protein n=1 Tax=Hyphomicrobium sp. D-2 TaxID=3041621 RepID=UPI00245560F7|nr:autotransporter outer membrane beta-barrel domain-containing protein [Hyphomicrobium sp. D-2]MDH4983783.1 autotransporter outer membrane beta-barrel domain-containing protein [Hyphomicrobium sp. D-2]
MHSIARSFRAARIAAALAAVTLSASLTPHAYAASGYEACSDVNAGLFNLTNHGSSGGPLITVSGFRVGDTITFWVTSTAPPNQSSFVLKNGAGVDRMYVTLNGAHHLQVSYKVAGGAANDGTLQTFFGVVAGTYNISVTATCTPASAQTDAAAATAIVASFVDARVSGILMSAPSSTSIMNRGLQSAPIGGTTDVASVPGFAPPMALGAGAGSSAAIGRGASRFDDADESTLGSRNVQFRNSLSQMRRDASAAQMEKHRMALGAGDGGALPLAYETASPWDIWVEGRYSAFDDDTANLGRSGHVGLLYVGGDYRVTENMIVGVLAQFDWAKDETGALQSKIDGNGWMIGPYMSARVHQNIYLDVRAAWGRSSNDLALAGATGAFDTSRWLVQGTLAGNWAYDAWRITPSADLAYASENADGFTDSTGTFIAGQKVSLGRLQFGPEIGYRIRHTADAFIEPFAAIKGVWDFDDTRAAFVNGVVVGPGEFWGRLQGGLNVVTAGGVYVRGMASWDGMGAGDYNGYTLQGTVNVPLN